MRGKRHLRWTHGVRWGASSLAVVLGVALMLATALVAPVSTPSPSAPLARDPASGGARVAAMLPAWSRDVAFVRAQIALPASSLRAWIERNWRRAPALMIGLGALVALPPLAVLGWLARRIAGRRRTVVRPAVAGYVGEDASAGDGDGDVTTRPVSRRSDGYTWPVDAWIEIEGRPETRRPVVHDLMRIGSEADNEIVIEGQNVHRYHAAIRRTDDAEIRAVDFSPREGEGMQVNGKASHDCRLRDGDVITLGSARLVFRARRS